MARLRLPHRASAERREAPLYPAPVVKHSPATVTHLLFRSWAGRLFLASAALRLLTALLSLVSPTLPAIGFLGLIASLGLIVSLGYFLWRIVVLTQRELLWRVRRKLIISYIFIGVVPAMLIIGFFLLSAGVV